MAKKADFTYDEATWRVQDSFVYREIRRTNRNQMLILLALLAVLSVLLIYPFAVKSYLSRQESRAPKLSVTEIAADQISARLPFSATFENSADYRENVYRKRACYSEGMQFVFTLSPDEVLPSNIVPVENSVPTIGESVATGKSYIEYVLLRFGDRYLLTKRPIEGETAVYSGMLCYLPSDVRAVAAEAAGIPEDAFLPMLYDAGQEIFSTLRTDLLFWGIAFLIWLCFFLPLVRRMADPTRHEAYKKIYVYAGATEENIRALDRELAGPGVFRAWNKITTPSWILTRKFLSFEAKMKDRN